MKTVTKMPKIDESDMETMIIKQEESVMKTVTNTKNGDEYSKEGRKCDEN